MSRQQQEQQHRRTRDIPLQIRKVHINGLNRTNPSIIEDEFQLAYHAQTGIQVQQGIIEGVSRLKALDMFDTVDVVMDIPQDKSPNMTDLYITIKEKQPFKFKMETFTTNKGGTGVEVMGSTKNILGHAETSNLTLNTSYDGSTLAKFNVSKHRINGTNITGDIAISDETANNIRYSSYQEQIKGISAGVTTHDGKHAISYEFNKRNILPKRNSSTPFAYDASHSIIKEAQPSVKSSIKHVFTNDHRDHPSLPLYGSLLKVTNELAGIPFGDVNFLKTEVNVENHIPFLYDRTGMSLSLSTRFGAILSNPITQMLNNNNSNSSHTNNNGSSDENNIYNAYNNVTNNGTRLSDRFFVGGGTSLRGFDTCGIGPRANPKEGGCKTGDALGGDLQYQSMISLNGPLPESLLGTDMIKYHIYANAGNLIPWSANIDKLITDSRVSVGTGLYMGLGAARVEFNYSIPLIYKKYDKTTKWQFGVGISV